VEASVNDPSPADELQRAKDEFLAQWGAAGSAWGVNRTMAQIHALLMVTPNPLSTDEVMAQLGISRGNAHANLRGLVDWGLVRSVFLKGERKERFAAEKDVWRIFCTVARERKRREIDPVIEVLRACGERTAKLEGADAAAFRTQIQALLEFTELAASALEKAARPERSGLVPRILRLLK
jgi:DNA-binding transcriptional regulator GbsR (MarR family)